MKAIKIKLGKGGRIVIPADFRNNLNLETGDDIVLHMENNLIYLTTADQALKILQNKVKNYINSTGHNISLVDELVIMRKVEAKHE